VQVRAISLVNWPGFSILPEHSFAMKHANLARTTAALLFLLAVASSLAQLPSLDFGVASGAPGTDFTTLFKLFAGHPGFTAKSEVRMYDKAQKETISVAMNFAYLENKIRMEIDVAQMKNKDLPAAITGQLKSLGMDQVVMLIRPDRKSVHVLYPKLEACLTQPLPKETATDSKLEKQAIGKETLEGQPCEKNRVTFTSAKGGKEELTVWYATNLKDFPVQVLTKQGDETVVTRYQQIQLLKPDAKLFDLPAGFKEYSDLQSFMQGITAKIIAGEVSETK
jgi:hypothetical protein